MPRTRSSPRNVAKPATKAAPPSLTPPATPAEEEETQNKLKTPPTRRRKSNQRSSSSTIKKEPLSQDEDPTGGIDLGSHDVSCDGTYLDDDAKTNSSTSSLVEGQNSSQPVGQQLLEQLEKGKRKSKLVSKKISKPCASCGSTEGRLLGGRARKCTICRHVKANHQTGAGQDEVHCPHCNKKQTSSSSSSCSNCEKPLVTEPSPLRPDVAESSTDSAPPAGSHDESEAEFVKRDVEPSPPLLVSVGYGGGSFKNNLLEPLPPPSPSDLTKLLKRRFFDENLTGSQSQGTQKLSFASSDSENQGTSTSNNSITSVESSPLLEYAQKISARVMIPPEIPPQAPRKNMKQVKKGATTAGGGGGGVVKGGGASSSKGVKGSKGKRGGDSSVTTPTKNDEHVASSGEKSPAPPTAPPPLQPADSIPSLADDLSSRHSAPPIFTSSDYALDSRSSSLADPLIVSVTTKPHDPTINSIRTLHSSSNYSSSSIGYPFPSSSVSPLTRSMTPPTYTHSLPPPLITSRTPPLSRSLYSPPIKSPPLFTNSGAPPPLVSVSRGSDGSGMESYSSWYLHPSSPTIKDEKDENSVTHHPVIVDPLASKKTNNKDNAESAMETEDVSMETKLDGATPLNSLMEEERENGGVEENTEDESVANSYTLGGGEGGKGGGGEDDTGAVLGISEDTNELSPMEIVSEIKTKHKRKQKLELVKSTGFDEEVQEEGGGLRILKKKKKKKKKEREKERGGSGHHHKEHHRSEKKKKKKSKKKDRSDHETASQTEEDDEEHFPESNGKGTPTGHSKKSIPLYTVIIGDATFHQLRWGQYRMTLLVPHTRTHSTAPAIETTPVAEKITTPVKEKEKEKEEPVAVQTRSLRSSGRKRLRETEEREDQEQQVQEEDEQESKSKKMRKGRNRQQHHQEDPLPQSSSQTEETGEERDEKTADTEDDIVNILPSFSVFELRNKLFVGFPPRTVHAFTYKLKAKTQRPPLHWIHILRHMGGLPDNCHTCRLLDVDAVKQMCELHNIEVPHSLDLLLNNSLSEKRKVYDLSGEETLSFVSNPDLLSFKLPKCDFNAVSKKKSSRESKAHKFLSIGKPDDSVVTTPSQMTDDTQSQLTEEDEVEDVKPPRPLPPHSITTKDSSRPSSSSNAASNAGGGPGASGRKKPCPHCGVSMLCKSKKCRNCGKLFGVFTFGRRVCTMCGHINLARMTVCFRCSHPLDKAPSAHPKDVIVPREYQDLTVKGPSSSSKVDFKFGVKRRRRSPLPQKSKHSLVMGGVGGGGDGEAGSVVDAGESVDEFYNEGSDSPPEKRKKRKHEGYKYGKIPWSDADLALVITTHGTPKFCLQEMCNKVLRFHNKTDVFELVKNLHLSLEQGSTNLLRKLQALGLHPNRSPICKLISSEDLFALMDALEEPVPEEVHQHLETISSHSTPMSPESINSGDVVASPTLLGPSSSSVSSHNHTSSHHHHHHHPSTTTSLSLVRGKETETENEFESTLHDIRCSDGQSLSMLRTWNGDHFLCLLEVWRRYFPEVNRSHLTTVIKKLLLETQIPTTQQTNLLRAANVISMRGAPGRLIRLRDVQRLLDDFGIPVNIGGEFDEATPSKLANRQFLAPMARIPRHSYLSRIMASDRAEMKEYSDCMKNIIDLIDSDDLQTMLEGVAAKSNEESSGMEVEITALSEELDLLQRSLFEGRDLCQALSDEIAFLTVTNYSQMTEISRLSKVSIQSLYELEPLLDTVQLMELAAQ